MRTALHLYRLRHPEPARRTVHRATTRLVWIFGASAVLACVCVVVA